jgi:hypothetical protein
MVNTDVDAEIAAMYEDMMKNDFMTVEEEQEGDANENHC